ncbi:MAG: NAD(+) diphosphatase [Rhodospirillales bacterium]|jgi:NAD+ diphosphatase|nr:NAD(+) diphosphatase [Rhodospirillales bacterium]
MPYSLAYASVPLDRAANLRGNEDWLNQQKSSANARVLVVWRDCNLIKAGEEPEAVILSGEQARNVLDQTVEKHPPVFLGMQDDAPVFMAKLSHLTEEDALNVSGSSADQAAFVDLRSVGPLISQDTGSLLAMARAMAYWHRRHMFCGACGADTASETGGHVRRCTNSNCNLEHFPRTDPAVIMLVTTTMESVEHCLLGRQASWAARTYSSLAGFVEPGESLETAVLREVLEESGIKATNAKYQASQPWPFPSSLMLGFRARALTHEIDTSSNELEDARWFSHAEIIDIAENNRDDHKLSRSDSIASWLIEDWIKNP